MSCPAPSLCFTSISAARAEASAPTAAVARGLAANAATSGASTYSGTITTSSPVDASTIASTPTSSAANTGTQTRDCKVRFYHARATSKQWGVRPPESR